MTTTESIKIQRETFCYMLQEIYTDKFDEESVSIVIDGDGFVRITGKGKEAEDHEIVIHTVLKSENDARIDRQEHNAKILMKNDYWMYMANDELRKLASNHAFKIWEERSFINGVKLV